jgi:large subunit ribosomal protein L22
MVFRAVHRFARISPRKVRRLADLIRYRYADEALNILRFQPHRGARMLEKVLLSAIANARDPEQNPGRTVHMSDLYVIDVRVDGGPMYKRIRPRARGMASFILRRTSHIRVAVADVPSV